MFKVLRHLVPWNYDKIRLYNGRTAKKSEVFIGEYWIKIERGMVRVLNNKHYPTYIRRDLPSWSSRHGSWEYWYL